MKVRDLKKREARRSKLVERKDKLKIEQSIVRRTRWLISQLPPHARTPIKASIYFDHLFVSIELNDVKRYRRLVRVFKLRPIASDLGWLDLMIRQLPVERVKSRTLGNRYGLTKLTD